MTEDAAPGRFDEKRLDKLIDEAIVDCYDESEQATGLFVAIEQNVRVPFIALDGDERVTVTGFDQDELLVTAICEGDGGQDDIPLIDLTLTTPLPEGAEWIAAYCYWARHAGVGYDDEEEEDEA